MSTYWFLFALPIFWALLPAGDDVATRIGLTALAGIYVIAIGFRQDVGCDWGAYVFMYEVVARLPFWKALFFTDSGYQALDFIAYWLGLGYYFAEFVSGLIFTACLFLFIRRQPLPWLALLCAAPYMVIVVAMGYQRQSISLGFCMLAMLAFGERSVLRFVAFVLIGALFHKSLLFILPLVVLINGLRFNWLSVLTLAATGLVGGRVILGNTDYYLHVYQNKYMTSAGGLTRILVTALAGLVFLIFIRQYKRLFKDWDLLLYLAIISLILVPLVKISTTAVDRMAIYMLPFQIMVFSRLPVIFRATKMEMPVSLGIVGSYATFLYVWLHYSLIAHECWLPYRSVLF